jgi:hypothetical protein
MAAMRNQTNWNKNTLLWGLVMAVLGTVMVVAGLVLTGAAGGPAFIGRLVLSSGAVLLILGIVSLLQYAYVRRNPKAGRQMMISERDERLQLIRAKAGQRAYQISSALAFAVLMWASFAGDVGLPTLSGNALWFALLAVVVVPALVYIGYIVYEQSNS